MHCSPAAPTPPPLVVGAVLLAAEALASTRPATTAAELVAGLLGVARRHGRRNDGVDFGDGTGEGGGGPVQLEIALGGVPALARAEAAAWRAADLGRLLDLLACDGLLRPLEPPPFDPVELGGRGADGVRTVAEDRAAEALRAMRGAAGSGGTFASIALGADTARVRALLEW